jgi:N-acetylglucosaminyldiphosphoundecaprenol N-acetyl-beta-D-mannosaminyltransferase
MTERVEILGIQFDNLTQRETLKRIGLMVRSGQPHQIVTPAIEQLITARRSPDYNRMLQEADLVVPDGMPVIFASRWHKTPLQERITGVDLVPEICRLAAEEGFRVFFFGAMEGIAQETADLMRQRFPKLQIAGVYSPPYKFEEQVHEEHKAIQLIQEAKPDVLLVAISSPRAELWIHRRKQEIHVPVMIGIGGSFNFLTGREKRAPQWIQNIGMEGIYRFLLRPREIGRRIIINAPYFFLLLFDLLTYRSQKRIALWSRPILLGLVDALLAPGAFLLAIWFYFRSGIFSNAPDPFPEYKSLLEMPAYSDLPVFVSLLTILALWSQRLYLRDKYISGKTLLRRIFTASILSVFLLIAFQFLFKDIFMADRFLGFSRMVFGFYGLFLFFMLSLWRWGFLRLEYALHRLRINLDRLILVGMTPRAKEMVQTMLNKPELGNLPLGYVLTSQVNHFEEQIIPFLGTLADLERLLPARKVDEILVADNDLALDDLLRIVTLCRKHKVALSLVPTLQELLGASSEIKRMGDLRVITVALDTPVAELLVKDGEKDE